MSVVALLLAAAVCFESAHSQVIAITDPPTTNENPAVIAAPENATNVTMFCTVTRVGTGIRQNAWIITKPGVPRTVLEFNPTSGLGQPNFENYFATGDQSVGGVTLRTNLTIRVFDTTFDMANITCGSGIDIAINGTFFFRIIGK